MANSSNETVDPSELSNTQTKEVILIKAGKKITVQLPNIDDFETLNLIEKNFRAGNLSIKIVLSGNKIYDYRLD
mgnify:CR=1 FL=1